MKSFALDDLNPVEFEEFCFKLLQDAGFVNIDWRKGTGKDSSPSDSGRDIVAYRQLRDPDGHVHLEKWFVDCKHYKKGVPPEEVLGLLTWSHSERPHVALVIASNYLSNPCKDWLEGYVRSNGPPFRVRYWERQELNRFMGHDPGSLEVITRPISGEQAGAPALGSRAPGPLEWLALYEKTMPAWADTEGKIGPALDSISSLMKQAAADIQASNAGGQGYPGMLEINRRLASELAPLVEKLEGLYEQGFQHLKDVDPGLREHIRRAIERARSRPTEAPQVCAEFQSIRTVADAILASLSANDRYIRSRAGMTSQTSDMRQVEDRLLEAAKLRAEGRPIVKGWMALMDGAGIGCEEA